MGIARTFRGGVHPHETGNGKASTNAELVSNAKAPARVTIPLSQHIGAACKCVVTKGQKVLVGQVIGEAEGFVSAPIHSSVSGTVTALISCPLANGVNVPAVVIENDFQDLWDENVKPRGNVESLDAKALLEIIRNAGIVGLGGATFPTAVKLAPPKETNVDLLVVNGAECEPYLTSDHRLMLEHPEQIIRGTRLALKALGAKQCIIGIEDNKPDAVASMQSALKGDTDTAIDVTAVPAKYPQGGEKQLLYTLTQRVVPVGGLPSSVGAVVINVSTAAAICAAVYEGKPLIDRVVTIAGMVKKPANLRARIGTPLGELIEQCDGLQDGVTKIVLGGPMMGTALSSLDIPVTKGTSGLLALGKEGLHASESPCIRCGRCAEGCPMHLVPTKIDAYARRSRWDEAEQLGALNCMECGVCTYICPAKRELTQGCRMAKSAITAKRKKS